MRTAVSKLFPFNSKSRPTDRARRAERQHRTGGLRLESLEKRQLLAAEVLQIQIENLSDPGGLAQTPVWVASHDGNFDVGTLGEDAGLFGGLEALAEEGDVSGLVARFGIEGVGEDAVIAAPEGFAGAPVFEPVESVIQTLNVTDTMASPYFSYASMVIPSNDAFIANLNPTAIRLFDEVGDFLGPKTIVVTGSQVWDAGTEVNDPLGGAAFATAGGISADEGGVITSLSGLDEFVGAELPTGENLAKAFGGNTPILRITISQASVPSSPADSDGPTARLDVDGLDQRADYHEISVTYSDPSGVDLNSIAPENLRITGPLLTSLEILSVETDAPDGTVPREVTATYRVAPQSGSFTALDNGTYSVVLLDDQVNDPFDHESTGQLLGDFTVAVPVRINVSYENLGDDGGLAQTPVWVGAHDGGFEVARSGSPASDFPGLEALAEEGALDELIARFGNESNGNGLVLLAPDGFAGAPVFEPGETITQALDVDDPAVNRYFSYASMVIPSNDAFIANLDPRGIELFDLNGNFTGARTITIYGQDVWDAGTEVNDAVGGAAFSTEGGTPTDENGVIRRHEGLDDFVGTGLPTTETLASAFEGMTPIGRFTISLADIPASPIDGRGPLATADAVDATVTGSDSHEIRVTYSDGSGIDLTSIDVNDLQIRSSTGNELAVVSVSVDAMPGDDVRNVTATYELEPTDGNGFSTADNGLYFITLATDEVGDSLGNGSEVTSLGSFEVRVAVPLQISIENLSIEGGLSQTPFWIGVHEGNFQIAAAGQSAGQFGGLEELAEEGDVSGVVSRFGSESGGVGAVVTAPGGFAGAPVIEPGESSTVPLNVFDTNLNRFFSFASMVIPSNDAFVANLNPRAYELFDDNGFFTGERTITIYGSDVWDAGTEVNAVGGGAAFSTAGGTAMDESGVVRRHTGLSDFIGSGLPTGEDLQSAFRAQTPLARITIGLAGGSDVPIDRDGPTASVVAEPVTTAGTATREIDVTYSDPSGIDLGSIGSDDIVVTGPSGNVLNVVSATTDAVAGTIPKSVTVTYTVTTSDDQFTARDNGRYAVEVAENGVNDSFGIGSLVSSVGSLTVDVGVRLQVTITSQTELGGLSQTPFWVGFHDGGFEVARQGLSAAGFGGLELIAETGDASELAQRFMAESTGTDSVITSPAGFPGAPVFEPGESVSQVIEVENSGDHRYFSFASMVIPSNDAFVATINPRRYELFDDAGNFRGAREITLYGRDILDAGTEVNDPLGGAAFATGGGAGIDENGFISQLDSLNDFIGTGLPTGETLQSAFGPDTVLATITVSLFDPEAEICSGAHAACSARSVSLQNAERTTDVNRDGRTSALDALLVVNFLNEFGNRSTIADEAQALGLDLDVGGDTEVSALDALIVINELNSRAEAASQGEPIGSASRDAAFASGEDFSFGSLSFNEDRLEDEAVSLLF